MTDIGSRLGLASSDSKALAAWADTRNSVVAEQQNIFTSQVLHPTGGGGEPRSWTPRCPDGPLVGREDGAGVFGGCPQWLLSALRPHSPR